MRFHNNCIVLLAMALLIAGCGGGSDNSPAPARSALLLAQAGDEQSVSPGDYVLLDGTGSATRDDTAITDWQWTQTDGTDVTLLNTEQAQAAFVAPAMEEEGELVFQLQVTDESGRTATDTTTVRVAAGEMPSAQPQVFHVCGDNDEEFRTAALTALFEAREGDLIEFCAGEFNLTTGLILNNRRGITIRGQGMDETVLSFKGSEASEGLNISGSDGIALEGFTIEDTPGKAELRVEGANVAATFDYEDPHPQVDTRCTGSVESYQVPAAMNCMTCHAGDNREAGAAPIGPKARLMNREFDYGGDVGQRFQLEYMAELGMLAGLPEPGNIAEPLPTWNRPGSSGETGNNDIHLRARAYLETNCVHCHNPGGAASNSNLELDSFRAVDRRYGICKRPVAAGKGSGDRRWVLVPGESAESILHYRVASTEAGVMMPPIGRTLGHTEAMELLTTWLDESLEAQTHEEVHNGENCGGLAGELPEESDPLLQLLEQLGLLGLVDELEANDPGLLDALESGI